jgi:hypothetical protein
MALLYLCLAGMEAAWITPFWLLIYASRPPWTAYVALLAGLLAWTLVLELLSRAEVQSPAYELIALALMAVTSLLVVWLLLYRTTPLSDIGWLRRMLSDLLNFTTRIPPAVGVVAINLVLWQRATAATSRPPSFFNVGVSFRLGILLLIAGAGLVSFLRGLSAVWLLWIFFTLGLIAVAIARINEKAGEAQSTGRVLPMRRFAQLLLAAGLTVGGAWLLSFIYAPENLRRSLNVLDPIWRFLGPLVFALLLLIAEALNPFFEWLTSRLSGVMSDATLPSIELAPAAPAESAPGVFDKLPAWLPRLLADVAVGVAIIVLVLAIGGFLLLYLERVRKGARPDQAEEEGAERLSLGGILERGARVVRNAAGLIRRFGLGTQLLAAISVQNIYANVSRLARGRGYPRRPAQPPDDYLPDLVRAFGGCEDQLRRITAAYMRVHYGDHPVAMAELAQLREDYRAVREGEAAN